MIEIRYLRHLLALASCSTVPTAADAIHLAVRVLGCVIRTARSHPIASLFFDLDGTLTNPRDGIVRSIQYALKRLDRPIPPGDELTWCIGPPLKTSFGSLLGTQDSEEQQAAVELYRERYRDIGIFENAVYDGIPEALIKLTTLGHRLYVVSSKPLVFVERIIDHFALEAHFDGMHGSELSGERTRKAELIAYVLATRNIDAANVVMIGDRRHDIEGAIATGVRPLGVTWGFGSEAELREAGAFEIIDQPADLADWGENALRWQTINQSRNHRGP